jgi:hypothetical protein
MQKAYVGIDPGKNGAACLLAPDKIHFHDFESGPDAALTVERWNAQYKLFAGIEKVNSFKSDGHAFAFRFGDNFGVWKGILYAYHISHALIAPPTWQSAYLPGWNKKGVDNKRTAVEIARALYPQIKKVVYLKKHADRADALLIADFVKRRG